MNGIDKDWIGNSRTAHATLGARNYAQVPREEDDYYATEPRAVEILLKHEKFCSLIWEPACGEGHIAEVLKKHGYTVFSTDIRKRGYEDCCIDFLQAKKGYTGDIVTNPPYSKAMEFVNKALEVVADKHKVAMFLKLQFLEGKARYNGLFKINPPIRIYVSVRRLRCAMRGDFEKYSKSNAIAYAWYIWEKGYSGDPIIKWCNTGEEEMTDDSQLTLW